MLLDGSSRVDAILDTAMPWDVMGGVARRAWAQNTNSIDTCIEFNHENVDRGEHITLPWPVDEEILQW